MGQRGMEVTRAINSGKSSVLLSKKLIFVTLVWLFERYTTSGMTTLVSTPHLSHIC